MRRGVKCAWVLTAIVVLVVSLLLFDGRPNSDVEILLGYAMLVLSFPLGVVSEVVLGVAARALFEIEGYIFTVSYFMLFAEWLVLFIVGYLQWFVFLPRIWIWCKRRRSCDISSKLGTKEKEKAGGQISQESRYK